MLHNASHEFKMLWKNDHQSIYEMQELFILTKLLASVRN